MNRVVQIVVLMLALPFCLNAKQCAFVDKDSKRCKSKASANGRYCGRHSVEGVRQEREKEKRSADEKAAAQAKIAADAAASEKQKADILRAREEGKTHSSFDKMKGIFGKRFMDVVDAKDETFKRSSNVPNLFFYEPQKRFLEFNEYYLIADGQSQIRVIGTRLNIKGADEAKAYAIRVSELLERKYGRPVQAGEGGRSHVGFLLFGCKLRGGKYSNGERLSDDFSHELRLYVNRTTKDGDEFRVKLEVVDLAYEDEYRAKKEKNDMDALD